MSPHIVVFVTVPDEPTGLQIARALVGEKLAACVNLVGPIRSVYTWKGQVQEEPEHLLVIKTRQSLFATLCGQVTRLHPYEVPELIALPIEEGLPAYLRWIDEVTLD